VCACWYHYCVHSISAPLVDRVKHHVGFPKYVLCNCVNKILLDFYSVDYSDFRGSGSGEMAMNKFCSEYGKLEHVERKVSTVVP
jgi:hypothetical protein